MDCYIFMHILQANDSISQSFNQILSFSPGKTLLSCHDLSHFCKTSQSICSKFFIFRLQSFKIVSTITVCSRKKLLSAGFSFRKTFYAERIARVLKTFETFFYFIQTLLSILSNAVCDEAWVSFPVLFLSSFLIFNVSKKLLRHSGCCSSQK